MTSTGVPAEEGPVPVLPPDDQKRVVQILAGAGAFTSDQRKYLDELIDSRSRIVRSLFKAYEDNRDVNSLIRGLFGALPASLKGPAQQAAAKAAVDTQIPAETASVDPEPSTAAAPTPTPDYETVEQKFLQIIKDMSLSHLETAALRLAIARGDTSVAETLERFRATMDEDALTPRQSRSPSHMQRVS